MTPDDQRSDPSLRYVNAVRAVKRDLAEQSVRERTRAGEAAPTEAQSFSKAPVHVLWIVGGLVVFYVVIKLLFLWNL